MTIPVGTGGAERNIYLLYDHAGKKLRKNVNDQGTVLYTQDYVNGLEYRTASSGGALPWRRFHYRTFYFAQISRRFVCADFTRKKSV